MNHVRQKEANSAGALGCRSVRVQQDYAPAAASHCSKARVCLLLRMKERGRICLYLFFVHVQRTAYRAGVVVLKSYRVSCAEDALEVSAEDTELQVASC